MDLNLAGLRVVITAGASGIGLVTARAFAEEGARVVLCDIDAAAVEGLASTDPTLTAFRCDVADREAVSTFMDDALGALGGIDCLVNNAGIAGPTAAVDEIDPADWDECLTVCLTSQFNLARLAVPHLKASDNASIINLSSAAGRLGFALRTPYAAAKFGVVGFTKSLAVELGPYGIRANAILPGVVEGDRIRRVFEGKARARNVSAADVEAEALSRVSMRTMVTARQLADQMLFLASERGRTISGQAVAIDGDLQMLA